MELVSSVGILNLGIKYQFKRISIAVKTEMESKPQFQKINIGTETFDYT